MGVTHNACEQCREIFCDNGYWLKTFLIQNYEDCLYELMLCRNCSHELDNLLGPKDDNGEQALTIEFLEWNKKRVEAKIQKLQEELTHMETLKPPTRMDLLEEEEKKQNKNKRKTAASEEEPEETKKAKSA